MPQSDRVNQIIASFVRQVWDSKFGIADQLHRKICGLRCRRWRKGIQMIEKEREDGERGYHKEDRGQRNKYRIGREIEYRIDDRG